MNLYQVNINNTHTFNLSNTEIRSILEIYLNPITLREGHFYRINLELLKEFANDHFVRNYTGRKNLLKEIKDAEQNGLTQIVYYCSE
jgi:hypothetical protein